MGAEVGAQGARSRAVAVLRIRSRALAVALLPAAVAVVLLVGGSTGHLTGAVWDVLRWVFTCLALLVLLAAAGIALVVARARPAVSPTVPITEESAPDLYRMVRDLADRLDVPAPSAIALTPDCDSWLEDRTHPAHGPPPAATPEDDGGDGDVRGLPGTGRQRRAPVAPVLVIGSPFLWWMRVGELRAILAPVVAGTGPSAHPDIAAARRFVRGLDAAVAVTSQGTRGPVSRAARSAVGWVARLLLRSCRAHAAEMERGVAAAAAERAQAVDYGVRIVAQEQVGLAYAGWDRLLTRVALPAWRMGRWPSRLDVGVVAALTELSRRDRLAEGFASRLGERPACDLLEEPGAVDEAASLLAARLFHGGPAESGPDWAPVHWDDYAEEVVDRKWRTDAARLHRVLDALGVSGSSDVAHGPTGPGPDGPTLARVLDHLAEPGSGPEAEQGPEAGPEAGVGPEAEAGTAAGVRTGTEAATDAAVPSAATTAAAPVPDGGKSDGDAGHGTGAAGEDAEHEGGSVDEGARCVAGAADEDAGHRIGAVGEDGDEAGPRNERAAALAAALSAEVAREEAAAPTGRGAQSGVPGAAGLPASTGGQGPDAALWDDSALPLFPLQPPRTGRELLADHVTAMVCCAAMDTAGAAPGLDWLDGPALLMAGERDADLAPRVLSLVEDADPAPLLEWLRRQGVRPEKPVRLV
ncbi:hypothetical protein [Streptomyces minutiscleroticus]|uniref:Uncharacterized protein n=1 Tax=Streptomyces minutiscleroticus TaxID=68238 RepID=A0A918NWZ2_9ACTN|nr:hypothetical protein GCM10010358_66610 [Streptomyces minutiscleroticus]